MNWLNTRNSPGFGGIADREIDAAQGIADVEEAAGLPALAVDRERQAEAAWTQNRFSTVPKTSS